MSKQVQVGKEDQTTLPALSFCVLNDGSKWIINSLKKITSASTIEHYIFGLLKMHFRIDCSRNDVIGIDERKRDEIIQITDISPNCYKRTKLRKVFQECQGLFYVIYIDSGSDYLYPKVSEYDFNLLKKTVRGDVFAESHIHVLVFTHPKFGISSKETTNTRSDTIHEYSEHISNMVRPSSSSRQQQQHHRHKHQMLDENQILESCSPGLKKKIHFHYNISAETLRNIFESELQNVFTLQIQETRSKEQCTNRLVKNDDKNNNNKQDMKVDPITRDQSNMNEYGKGEGGRIELFSKRKSISLPEFHINSSISNHSTNKILDQKSPKHDVQIRKLKSFGSILGNLFSFQNTTTSTATSTSRSSLGQSSRPSSTTEHQEQQQKQQRESKPSSSSCLNVHQKISDTYLIFALSENDQVSKEFVNENKKGRDEEMEPSFIEKHIEELVVQQF
jgi:hypothetical protein